MTKEDIFENVMQMVASLAAICIVFALVMATIFGVRGALEYAKGQRLIKSGGTADGVVAEKKFVRSSGRRSGGSSSLARVDVYDLLVTYSVDGVTYRLHVADTNSHSFTAEPDAKSGVQVGTKMVVLYDRANPADGMVNSTETLVNMPETAMLIGLLALLGDIPLVYFTGLFIAEYLKKKKQRVP